MENKFEKASRTCLRFESSKGFLTTEDLWVLPLESVTKCCLNTLAIEVHTELQTASKISFVTPTTIGHAVLELKLEILKHIIAVRQAENLERVTALARKTEKIKLQGILANKLDADLQGLSKEELEKRINIL